MADETGEILHFITDIAVAKQRSAAVSSEGKLFTWGRDPGCGVLGWFGQKKGKDEKRNAVMEKVPKEVLTFSNPDCKAWKVVFGAQHTLVLTQDQRIYAFGDDSKGQCGLGKLEAKNDPTQVDFGVDVKVG